MSRTLVAASFAVLCASLVANEPASDAPLPPDEAARTMRVPEGFHVTLFAGEPEVRQPISFCIDDRGRLWVAEAYNYPHHGTVPGDRILILEDTDHDGTFDQRSVFYDQLNYVTGVEVGFGGVWVMSPPYFYFIPDSDGDGRPDGEPQVLLDGFGDTRKRPQPCEWIRVGARWMALRHARPDQLVAARQTWHSPARTSAL